MTTAASTSNSADTLAPWGATLLRVSLGVMFVAHSVILKVFVFTVAGFTGFFESLGFPGFLALPFIVAEAAIGVALILGIQTRWAALASLPILLGAVWVHAGNGWVFSAEGGGWEYPLFLAVAAVVQALIGDGALALSPSRRLPFTGARGQAA